jgi:membrane protease YdiL (CAAX protease family)
MPADIDLPEKGLQPRLKPLRFWVAFLMFAVPSALVTFGLYVLMPAIARRVESGLIWWFLALYIGPLMLLVPAALVAYRLEGYPWSWDVFKRRIRLKRVTGRGWLWVSGIVAVGLTASVLLSGTLPWLADHPWFTPPDFIPPAVDPRLQQTGIPTDILGTSLVGNWGLLALYAGALVFNILGEELWMRGIILPRQEVAYGRWAWLIHGLMWCLFHFPQRWTYLQILPITLFLSYATSRTQNTTIAIAAHYIGNGLLGLIPLALVVAGTT